MCFSGGLSGCVCESSHGDARPTADGSKHPDTQVYDTGHQSGWVSGGARGG